MGSWLKIFVDTNLIWSISNQNGCVELISWHDTVKYRYFNESPIFHRNCIESPKHIRYKQSWLGTKKNVGLVDKGRIRKWLKNIGVFKKGCWSIEKKKWLIMMIIIHNVILGLIKPIFEISIPHKIILLYIYWTMI